MKLPFFFYLLTSSLLFGEIKTEIITLSHKLQKAKTKEEKSLCHYQLALAYLKDQEQDKAFESFLAALDEAPPLKKHAASLEEQAIVEEAFNYYLEAEESITLIAGELLKRYEKIADDHPEYHELGALVATAWANVGSYERFFKQFYSSYDPTHFLAYKAKGILLLRLSSHATSEVARKEKKEEAHRQLDLALEKNKRDPAIFRLLFCLAKEKKDNALTIKYLDILSQSDVKIPRSDIRFYVQETVELGRKEVGVALLNKAKERYAYSRAIQSAEEILKNAR